MANCIALFKFRTIWSEIIWTFSCFTILFCERRVWHHVSRNDYLSWVETFINLIIGVIIFLSKYLIWSFSFFWKFVFDDVQTCLWLLNFMNLNVSLIDSRRICSWNFCFNRISDRNFIIWFGFFFYRWFNFFLLFLVFLFFFVNTKHSFEKVNCSFKEIINFILVWGILLNFSLN